MIRRGIRSTDKIKLAVDVGLAASHLTRLPAGRNMASYLRFVGAEGADSEHVGGVRQDPAASLEEIAMKASEKDGARKMQLV